MVQVDENASLHLQFVRFGKERHRVTYKLLALLPKIYENKIYHEKGFATIEEYAGKLAGLSKGVVQKTLRIVKHLENKPELQKMIKTQGIHKVAIVAKFATPETDSDFADKVEHMSKSGLQELSKEIRIEQQGLNLRDARRKLSIELDSEMEFHFLTLKKRMGDVSDKEVLKRLLTDAVNGLDSPKLVFRTRSVKRKSVILKLAPLKYAAKRESVKKSPGKCVETREVAGVASSTVSTVGGTAGRVKPIARYIPVVERRKVLAKTGGRCAYLGCNRPADVFHHRDRFVSSKNHDSIVPLCKTHHDFAHNGLIENERLNPGLWRLRVTAGVQSETDFRIREYRKMAIGFV